MPLLGAEKPSGQASGGIQVPIVPAQAPNIPNPGVPFAGVRGGGGGQRTAVTTGDRAGAALGSLAQTMQEMAAKREAQKAREDAQNAPKAMAAIDAVTRKIDTAKARAYDQMGKTAESMVQRVRAGASFTDVEAMEALIGPVLSLYPKPEEGKQILKDLATEFGLTEDPKIRGRIGFDNIEAMFDERVQEAKARQEEVLMREPFLEGSGTPQDVLELALARRGIDPRDYEHLSPDMTVAYAITMQRINKADNEYDKKRLLMAVKTAMTKLTREDEASKQAGKFAAQVMRGGVTESGGEYAQSILRTSVSKFLAGSPGLVSAHGAAGLRDYAEDGRTFERLSIEQRPQVDVAPPQEVTREANRLVLHVMDSLLQNVGNRDEMLTAVSMMFPEYNSGTGMHTGRELAGAVLSPKQRYIVGELARAAAGEFAKLGLGSSRTWRGFAEADKEGPLRAARRLFTEDWLTPTGKAVADQVSGILMGVYFTATEQQRTDAEFRDLLLQEAILAATGTGSPNLGAQIGATMGALARVSPEMSDALSADIGRAIPTGVEGDVGEGNPFVQSLFEESGGNAKAAFDLWNKRIHEEMGTPAFTTIAAPLGPDMWGPRYETFAPGVEPVKPKLTPPMGPPTKPAMKPIPVRGEEDTWP